MLTGDVPFKGSNIPSIMKKHLMAPPPPLATPESGISPDVEMVVHRALEKQPEMRTASVEDFIAELEQAVLHPAPPPKLKAKRRSTAKATTVARRRKTSPIAAESLESSAAGVSAEVNASVNHSANAQVNASVDVSKEAVAPMFAQDVSTLGSPAPDVQTENTTAKFPPLRMPATIESEATELAPKAIQPALKASGPAARSAEVSASSEGNGKSIAPTPTSKLPVAPPTERRLPGRVVIGQQSLVGNLLKRRYAVTVAAGVVVIGLIVLSAFFYSRKEAGPPGVQSQVTGAANTKREMVLIEGGTFTMGWNKGKEQKGEHKVTVPSFYLDKYEVTNAEYAEFIKDAGKPAPNLDPAVREKTYWEPWNGKNPPSGREQWPVTNISPNDVEAFAAWLSKRDGVVYRLPTEEEWEYAARNGSTGSLFPWGNTWEDGRANINEKKAPVNVGSFPQGATQLGVQDMIGNVWEWTSSKPRFYDNTLPLVKNARVQRGGSFFEKMNSDFRNATERSWFGDENFKFPTIGFRLARDRR
jgi:formylglycine-generating enzyme required for sulfatase activity